MDDPGSIPLFLSLAALTDSDDSATGLLSDYKWFIAGIILCAITSFLFSGLEAGLLSLNRIWLSELSERGNKRAKLLQDIVRIPSRLITVMLTMETTSNVIIAVLWSQIGYAIAYENNFPAYWQVAWGIILILLVITFLEVLPKVIFASNAERLTMSLAPLANTLIKAVYPVAAVMEFLAKVSIWIFTRKWVKPVIRKVTEEDLITMVNVGEDEGVLEEQEKEMIHSIFEFGDLVAREIMVPRVDMQGIEINDSVENALALIVEHGHSRLPVYEGSIDHIKGLLYAKDLLRSLEQGTLESTTIEKLMRSGVFFVPESKDLSSLLEEMRARKSHMAIIMDEYSGTEGMVTIEDILEEIVGDIQDEYDKPLERLVQREPDGTFIVDAKLGLHDFDDEIGVKLPEDDGVETVGGLLYKVLGRIPQIGEVITIVPVIEEKDGDFQNDDVPVKKVQIRVLELEENRIGRVLVCLQKSESGICPDGDLVIDELHAEGGEQ